MESFVYLWYSSLSCDNHARGCGSGWSCRIRERRGKIRVNVPDKWRRRVMRRSVWMLAALGAGFPAMASAQVMCGSVVDETTELTEDIRDCDQDPAVTVVGPAVLMMNGQLISCSSTADPPPDGDGIDAGVKLIGRGAKLLGPGTIRHCHNGVVVGGEDDPDGGHVVIGVTVRGNEDGIEIRSPDNYVGQNDIINNLDDGIDIEGGRNTIIGNRVINSDDKGIAVNAGNGHIRNQILDNTITGNADDAIELEDTADETLVINNKINGNQGHGIDLEGDSNTVISNRIGGNKEEGIRAHVVDDPDPGEEPFSAENNQIINNRVHGNTPIDILDQNDFPCDGNEYIDNVFGSADPSSCIQ